MKRTSLFFILSCLAIVFISCSSNKEEAATPVQSTPVKFTASQLGPTGGFFTSIQFHPSTANLVFASGDDGTGLYRSTDAGSTWQFISSAGKNQSTYSLRFDPNNSSIIYAPNRFGRGLLKSTDTGATWTLSRSGLPITSNDDQLLHDLAISPANSNALAAATNSGLYISGDQGSNFAQATATGLTGTTKFTAVAYRSDGVLFAGKSDGSFGFSLDSGANFTQIIAPSGVGVDFIRFSSHWLYLGFKTGTILRMNPTSFVNTTINDSTVGGSIQNINILRFDVYSAGSSTQDVLLIGSSGNSTIATSRTGLFVSTDSGDNFSQIMNGITGQSILSVAINPTNNNVLLAGSGESKGLFKTTDSGANWSSVSSNIYATASIGFAQGGGACSHLVASNSAGGGFGANFESFNGGQTWALFNDPVADDGTASFYIDPADSNIILAGTITKGIWRTTSGTGGTWTQTLNETTRADRLINDTKTAGKIFAVFSFGSVNQSLYVSTDNGANFSSRSLVAWNLAIHPSNTGEAIAVNGADVFATNNDFTSTASLNLSSFVASEGGFTSVAYHPTNPSEVLVGTLNGGILKTTNYNSTGIGVSWTKLTTPIVASQIRDIKILTNGTKTIYYALTFGGQTSFNDSSTIGLFRSSDGGASWETADADISPSTIGWGLHSDRCSSSDEVWAGLWSGGLFKIKENFN